MPQIRAGLGLALALASAAAVAQAPDPDFVFVPPAGGGANDRFGTSIACAESWVVIGSPQRPFVIGAETHAAQGSVAVYTPGSDGYTLQANLVSLSGKANDFLGAAVDLAGGVIVAGAPGVDLVVPSQPLPNQLQAGGVFAWHFTGGAWNGPGFLTHPDPRSNDLFGSAVSLFREVLPDNGTRHTAAIGAPTDDHPIPTGGTQLDGGSVTIWEYSGLVWQPTAFIAMPAIPPETQLSTAGALFGTSLRIDGKFLIVGAKRASPSATSQGAVYVFRRSPPEDPAPHPIMSNPAWGDWVLVQRIVAEAPQANDQFGTSVDAQQGRLIIGAPNRAAGTMTNAGAAYIYARDPLTESYVWEATLFAADARPGNLLGASVSIWSDTALVGSPGVDYGAGSSQISDAGAAYLYGIDLDTCSTWSQKTEVSPPVSARTPDALFGSCVRVESEQLVVSAPRAPGPNGSQQGSAFSFPVDTIGCAWDLTGDGYVDGLDLSLFFAHWGGTTPEHFVADYDGDLVVGGLDLAYALGHWGPCECDDAQPPP